MSRATSMTLAPGLHISQAGACLRVHGCTSNGTYGCCYVMRETLAELSPEDGSAYVSETFETINKPSKARRVPGAGTGNREDAVTDRDTAGLTGAVA